jgi:hypothetical protein
MNTIALHFDIVCYKRVEMLANDLNLHFNSAHPPPLLWENQPNAFGASNKKYFLLVLTWQVEFPAPWLVKHELQLKHSTELKHGFHGSKA